jgi:polar amino acid transport system substrate-binding protein
MIRITALRLASVVAIAGSLTNPAFAQSEDSVLAKVKREGVLKVCYAQVTPESFKDPRTGAWSGVFIDVVKELADSMKVRIEPVEVQWATAPLSLKRGDCDLFGSSLVYTSPRALEINYIRPFSAKGVNALVTKEKSGRFQSPADLNSADVTIAVLAGSSPQELAQRMFPKAKILALQVNTDVATFDAVRRGDADLALNEAIPIRWFSQLKGNEWAVVAFKDDFATQPNGWAIRYGDPDWKAFLDSFSAWLITNNKAAKLYDEYLARPALFTTPK